MTELENLRAINAENRRAFNDLRERAWKMHNALQTTRGNIMSIKDCVGVGVIAYDEWLKVVEDALPPTPKPQELFK